MEHIVQFGINIDDEAIQSLIMKNAEENITRAIQKDFEEAIFEHSYYGNRREGLTSWMTAHIDKFFEDNKDAIVEKAAAGLVEKMARMKAVKEAAAKVAEGV